MSRNSKIVLAIAGLLLTAATWRREHTYRYHYDTLLQEGLSTTRLLGIPIHSRKDIWTPGGDPEDPYSSLYRQITGKEPDSQRWLQRKTDHIVYPWGALDLCYGFAMPFRERRDLLIGVYTKFRDGGSQKEAASHIARIDVLLPMPWKPRQEMDLKAIHTLRKELGLESAFDLKDPAKP